jgi:histidinol dehydrogenase
VTPLDRVGIYVPGGKAAYPSSVLMNALPAHVAGVGEIIMVVPTPRGRKECAGAGRGHVAGVSRAFTIGGAQAIAALAYGTHSIPNVDKITGPGNAYVASAKRRVFGTVGIDMIAGPSEILVLADGSTPPDWVAMDLFSQAEHDELAPKHPAVPRRWRTSTGCKAEIDRLLPDMPRAEIIAKSLNGPRRPDPHAQHGRGLRDQQPHRARSTWRIASSDPTEWEPLAASMPARFSWGASPANRWATIAPAPTTCCPPAAPARFSSPLGVYDFQKRSSLIEVSEAGPQARCDRCRACHGEGCRRTPAPPK